MQQRTVSTMQPLTGQTAGAANKLIVARTGIPILQKLAGYVNGADTTTPYYLMVFSGVAIPADTAKPLYEFPVLSKGGFSFDFGTIGGLDFSHVLDLPAGTEGLIVGVSSTPSTLTTSATTMDLEVTVNDFAVPIQGLSVAGDLTTAVALLAVFTNPQTVRKAVYNIRATNTDAGTTQYLGIYQTVPAANQIPLASFAVADGATIDESFGANGFSPFRQTAAVPPVAQNGCYLYVSTDATKFVAPSGTHWTIRAFYK